MENTLENIVNEDEIDAPVVESEVSTETQVVPKDPEVEKRENDFKSLRDHKKQLEQDARTARQEADELRKQMEYFRGKLEILEVTSPKAQEPKWENFNGDVDAYADAKAVYKQLQDMKKYDESKKQETATRSQQDQRKQQVDQLWAEKLHIAKAVDSDLQLAITKLESGSVAGVDLLDPEVVDGIKESVVGEELLKHLALHPTFASELAQLDKIGQARRLLALETMAKSRGGNLSHLRANVNSQPAPVVPPKISGQSNSARGSQSLKDAKTIDEWKKLFRSK